jgi:hypothetical protein
LKVVFRSSPPPLTDPHPRVTSEWLTGDVGDGVNSDVSKYHRIKANHLFSLSTSRNVAQRDALTASLAVFLSLGQTKLLF